MIVSKLMDDLLAAEVRVARSVGGKLLVPWKEDRSDFRRMAFPPIRACDVGLSWVNVGPTRQPDPRWAFYVGLYWAEKRPIYLVEGHCLGQLVGHSRPNRLCGTCTGSTQFFGCFHSQIQKGNI